MDYARFASSLGLQGITLSNPDDVGPAWEKALTADRPTVLDVHTNPDVPPVPPHTTFEQAFNTVKAFQGRRKHLGHHKRER
uniref:hypothetical protein n=1 Tax=Arthrobacter globiformis TaxID=1665 RepID=UPI0027D906AB|nr:hypothetical protein [Arthrobacter globiformis]